MEANAQENNGGFNDKTINCLPTIPGWNYLVGLYRLRKEMLEDKWQFPVT